MSHSGTQQPAWNAGKNASDQIVIGFDVTRKRFRQSAKRWSEIAQRFIFF